MVTKFTKRQLVDQCGFTAEETKTILDYQKKLPILVENDGVSGFCVNARDLWKQLGVKRKFSDWVIPNIVNQIFENEKDYIERWFKSSVPFEVNAEIMSYSSQKLSSLQITKEYYLTIDVAKEIAMYSGGALHASDDLKNNSRLARQYFILMEKAVKKNIEWELIRYPLREGYKKMQDALNDYMNRMIQKDADDWDYKIEANALNIIATGFSAQEIKLFVGCKDNITRDSLTATYNEYLLKLQEWNILCLGSNMNRYERYSKLKEYFDITFPNAVLLRNDVDIKKIIENKNKLIEEAKLKLQGVA